MAASKKNQDNTIEIVQKVVKVYDIPVTKNSVAEYLKAHPEYPSLTSVKDAFSEWKVENYAVRLNQEDLLELDSPFIAHVIENRQEQIVLVHAISKEKVIYSDTLAEQKTISFKEFCSIWDNIVILINPTKKSGEKDYKKKKENTFLENALLPLIISPFLIFITYNLFSLFFQPLQNLNLTIALIGAINLIGLILAIFLIMLESGNNNSVIDKICHIGKQSNCNTVLNSEASYIWGWISWADAGLIYFASSILILITSLFTEPALGLLSWLSLFALPYCIFSIYYQGIKVKKWCPLCLGTVAVLVVSIIFLAPYLSYSINIKTIINALLCFSSSSAIWLLYKAYSRKSQETDDILTSYLKIKRNSEIFMYLLTQSEDKHIPLTESSLLAGNPHAPITITAFLSLNCAPCARAFIKLTDLLTKSDEFKVNIILSEHGPKNVLNNFYYLNKEKGSEEFLEALSLWYSSQDKSNERFTETFPLPSDYSIPLDLNQLHRELFMKYNIQHTPTILVQGYQLPSNYKLEDVSYFVDTLKQVSSEVTTNKLFNTGFSD